jgi:hypothetical protein
MAGRMLSYGKGFERHKNAQQSVHPTSGSLRVFRHCSWLAVGAVKSALSQPAQPPVTRAVGRREKYG